MRYTKPWLSSTNYVLEDTEGNQAVTLEEKKEMVHKVTFLSLLADPIDTLPHRRGKAYQRFHQATVQSTPFNQLQKKAQGPDGLNISVLHLL